MQKADVRFGDWIEGGFDLYKRNFGLLIAVTFIATILSVVSLGLLAGPLGVGVIRIALAAHDRRDPPPEVGELFRGFDDFLQPFLFVLVWGLGLFLALQVVGFVPCLGPILSLAGAFAANALLMFGLFLIADRGLEFWPASTESASRVATNFLPFVGLSIVTTLIALSGSVACFVGVVLTAPLSLSVLTVAYRAVFTDDANAPVTSNDVQGPPVPAAPVVPAEPPPTPESTTESADTVQEGDAHKDIEEPSEPELPDDDNADRQ